MQLLISRQGPSVDTIAEVDVAWPPARGAPIEGRAGKGGKEGKGKGVGKRRPPAAPGERVVLPPDRYPSHAALARY